MLGDERKDADQHERADQRRGENPRERLDGSELGARVDVNDRGGKHADLAHPVERPGPDWRDAHHQIHDDIRHRGHEPQGKEIERALLPQARVDRAKTTAETVPDRLAEEKPGGEKRKRCAHG